jgi:dolichol-phosphate mannosyltransferase/undecaprenyl-phosphate 4-deoxy-4-formamido-L-arabinose transferase
MGTIDISIVIPVYKSSACMAELLRQLTETMQRLGNAYEVILIDDASPDDTWQTIESLAPLYPRVSAIQLLTNVGQHKATLCGMSYARGDIVITMDDDLQHPPDQLPVLIDALRSHPEIDCVYGCFEVKQHAAYRNLGSRVIQWINARSFGLPRDLRSSSLRLIRRPIASALLQYDTRNAVIEAILYATTHRIMSVKVRHAERYAGRSNYTLAKQFNMAFDHICNVSMLPLRLLSTLGISICLMSLIYVCYILYSYFSGRVGVAGWATVVILVSFFAGLTLLSLGIVGEYVIRILREVRGGPPFLIRRTSRLTPRVDYATGRHSQDPATEGTSP